MDLETDSVTGRVRERVGPSGVGDHVARCAIDVGAGHVGRDQRAACLLTREHHAVEMTRIGARIAERDRARHVGAVAVDDAAEVAHDELVAADDAIRRPRVRLGAVGAGRDDRIEAVAARAALAHRELELERELPFGDAVGQAGQQRLERVVGDRTRPADAVDLTRILHPAQVLDQRAGRHELHPRERRDEAPVLRPGNALILQAEPSAGRDHRGERGVLGGGGEPDLDADVGVDAGRAELLLRLLGVAAVGDEQRVVGRDEEHRGRAGEAGEVPDVGQLGHEERVEMLGGEPLAQAREPRCDLERKEHGRTHDFASVGPLASRVATASIASR